MKLSLTRAMIDELMASEVDAFFDAFYSDHGREPSGTRETIGRREFVAAIVDASARDGKSATITLTGDALAYAANDNFGPFATRADILSEWGPEYGSMARAFQARQRQCAEAIN